MAPRLPPTDEQMLAKAELIKSGLMREFEDLLDDHRLYRRDEKERRDFGRIIEKMVEFIGDKETWILWEKLKKQNEAREARAGFVKKNGSVIVTAILTFLVATVLGHYSEIAAVLIKGHL